MFSLNLVLGTFVSRRFMKQLMTGTWYVSSRNYTPNDTDDADTDDNALICLGKS